MTPRPFSRRLAALAGIVVFCAAAAVVNAAAEDGGKSLYRASSPAVLKPAGDEAGETRRAAVPSAATRDAFRQAYRQAGLPRLAVFWNRLFDDRLREMEAESRLVVEGNRDVRTEEAGKTSLWRDRGGWTASIETRREGARPEPLSEIAGSKFQTGFLTPLIEAGAAVVDRAAVMRLTEARRALADGPAGNVADRQLVETTALMEHADLLIQIALSPSGESPIGTFFHISIVDVKTGRLQASFFNDATFEKENAKKGWTATRGGYARVEGADLDDSAFESERGKKWTAVRGGYARVGKERKVDLERVGRILAAQAMEALVRVFAIGNEAA